MIGEYIVDRGVRLVERGLVPDAVTRFGIRAMCRDRLRELEAADRDARLDNFITAMRSGPVAPVPEKANEQHYEVPPEFFALVLGRHKKYSCCFWPNGTADLDTAERRALDVTAVRAQLMDGQDVLELGCGWGSLTLWMAERYPNARIAAVSNSASQRRYIEAQAAQRGLHNVRIITADMNDFDIDERFDRVISVEMFEHMRNYQQLLERVASWLRPSGRLFVHVFCHNTVPYEFETEGSSNWMGRYFFTGGIMPSHDLLEHFDHDLSVVKRWWWSGEHYERTANAWLRNMDEHRAALMPILAETYGDAERWFQRWRVFFMACAELFGYRAGREWGVGHYLLARPGVAGERPE